MSSNLILDITAVGAAKYGHGLRQMTRDYYGPCIDVRESSGNTNADIGFLNGFVNIQEIQDHCGSNDGFIETFYDLTGNGYDLGQSTHANQFKIWDGTTQRPTINSDIGVVGAEISTSAQYYTMSTPTLAYNAYTLSMVAKFDTASSSDNSQTLIDGNTAAGYHTYDGTTNIEVYGSPSKIALEDFGTNTFRYVYTDTKYRLDDDTSDQTVTSTGAGSLDGLTLGELRSALRGLGYHINGGYFHELIMWESTAIGLSFIQDDLNDYYMRRIHPEIPVPPIRSRV